MDIPVRVCQVFDLVLGWVSRVFGLILVVVVVAVAAAGVAVVALLELTGCPC